MLAAQLLGSQPGLMLLQDADSLKRLRFMLCLLVWRTS